MSRANDPSAWCRYYARRAAEGFGGEPRERHEVEAPRTVEARRQQVLAYIAWQCPVACVVISAGVGL